ncbi:hypothetical protein PC116_g19410 [Phytophthora cactorum]|nr:hypothetical protein PC114_g16953 [Phytophthora cactorum]KAG3002280.1 hypothetical protein PC119_g16388 [Phytophthora cactorum]KAG3148435.1 hypothetical protein C6341_g17399 [Phytophthora cactorum]KAG3172767.1 hypothetical protein PC128_g18455 [Phytophthora cactorum]KAG4048726.1 hypothetical protein PC123_g15966 [Phytophthora cactorum]
MRKPPGRRSHDDRYFNIRPGGSTRGQEGVDHVRGEEAVLEYYAHGTFEGKVLPSSPAHCA